MSHRRHLTDDLLLPELDTAQTVQVGHSPLPFDESDCDLPVRFTELRICAPRESSIETLMVRRPRVEAAPTVILKAARDPADDPSGLLAAPPQDRSLLLFGLLLVAISIASIAAGVLLSPILSAS